MSCSFRGGRGAPCRSPWKSPAPEHGLLSGLRSPHPRRRQAPAADDVLVEGLRNALGELQPLEGIAGLPQGVSTGSSEARGRGATGSVPPPGHTRSSGRASKGGGGIVRGIHTRRQGWRGRSFERFFVDECVGNGNGDVAQARGAWRAGSEASARCPAGNPGLISSKGDAEGLQTSASARPRALSRFPCKASGSHRPPLIQLPQSKAPELWALFIIEGRLPHSPHP